LRTVNNIPEIRAELLLNYLYPEAFNLWSVQNEGVFYRNYNSDLLAVDEERQEAQTARDSFIKLLPQGLITDDADLKGEDAPEKFKQLQLRLRLLRETFKPIDTFYFRESLYVEHQVDRLLQDKLSYILKTYFGVDIEQIENRYVREAAVLLPYVSKWRGDFGIVADLLRVLFKCEVDMTIGRYSHSDTTRRWLPMVRYELLIPGLMPEEYCEQMAELQPLQDFICEWFIPAEVMCQIDIREHHVQQQTNTRLTLGYNTEL
jgi:hypothetical protein